MNISCHEWTGYVILSGMKTMHAYLRLSTNLTDHTRDRCPDVVFLADEEEVAAIRTDVENPHIPVEEGELNELVIHDDALSRTIDEETWLQEFARVLAPGGTVRLTLPAAGMFAWLDPMNNYRYLADVSGRGHAPDAALPTGWNRHYTRRHIHHLLTDAGFEAPDFRSQSYVMQEIRLLTALLWENWIKQDRLAESRHFPQLGRRTPGKRSLLTTTWDVTARKR